MHVVDHQVRARFDVERRYKGRIGSQVWVNTGDYPGFDCEDPMMFSEEPQRWLVFARSNTNGELHVGVCMHPYGELDRPERFETARCRAGSRRHRTGPRRTVVGLSGPGPVARQRGAGVGGRRVALAPTTDAAPPVGMMPRDAAASDPRDPVARRRPGRLHRLVAGVTPAENQHFRAGACARVPAVRGPVSTATVSQPRR